MTEVLTLTEKNATGFSVHSTIAASRTDVIGATHSVPIATLTTVPDQLLYAGAIHPELRTVAPFEVRFEPTGGGYAAVAHDLEEYGLGDTRSDALEDLRKTLQELYLALERDEARLAADLLSVWTRLKSHISRVRR